MHTVLGPATVAHRQRRLAYTAHILKLTPTHKPTEFPNDPLFSHTRLWIVTCIFGIDYAEWRPPTARQTRLTLLARRRSTRYTPTHGCGACCHVQRRRTQATLGNCEPYVLDGTLYYLDFRLLLVSDLV